MRLIDRTRIVSYLNCSRLRYWGFEYQGRGLASKGTSMPLLTGIAIHSAVDRVADDPDNLDGIIRETLDDWQKDYQGAEDWFIKEQSYLLEGLIRTWTTYRLPRILEEFNIVASELEIPWELEDGLVDMVKCDKILRRLSDGMLFILELKTTSSANDYWAKQWIHNTQVLANTLAVQEKFGEPCGGVLIEGLEKGQRKTEKDGRTIQNSPLCYAWVKVKDNKTLISPSYTSGWTRTPVWDLMTSEDWCRTYIDEDVARRICNPLLPIKPISQQLDRWRAQTILQERRIVELIPTTLAGDLSAFPMNDEHCLRYGSPCQFEKICFTPMIEEDPRSNGYVYRTPHHDTERKLWQEQGMEAQDNPPSREDEAAAQVL